MADYYMKSFTGYKSLTQGANTIRKAHDSLTVGRRVEMDFFDEMDVVQDTELITPIATEYLEVKSIVKAPYALIMQTHAIFNHFVILQPEYEEDPLSAVAALDLKMLGFYGDINPTDLFMAVYFK